MPQWGVGIEDPLEFSPASYAIDLNLPDADNQLLGDAGRAIRREYRDSSKWKEMKCRNVRVIAMTRARSVLTMFSQRMNDSSAQLLYEVLGDCLDQLEERPGVETDTSGQDDLFDILDQVGHSHRKWLTEIWSKHGISQEPLQTDKGEIVADPLFSFRVATQRYACFGKQPPRQRIRQRLEDFGIKLVEPGQEIVDPIQERKP